MTNVRIISPAVICAVRALTLTNCMNNASALRLVALINAHWPRTSAPVISKEQEEAGEVRPHDEAGTHSNL